MSRRKYASRASTGTDATGMTAEDRAAARNYRTRMLAGGLVSKRYHQDMADITNGVSQPKKPGAGENK